jgi:tetratricopeptide (TPR) repeat protein
MRCRTPVTASVGFALTVLCPATLVESTEPAPTEKIATSAIERAREALAQGRSASAISDFLAAANASPQDPAPLIEAGRAALTVDDNDLALAHFQRALAADRTSVDARMGYATALSALRKSDLALSVWQLLATEFPDRADMKAGLARAHYDAGDAKSAKRLLSETLKIKDAPLSTRLLLVRLQIDNGSAKAALRMLDEILKVSPLSSDALMTRAYAHDGIRQWDRGHVDADAALAAAPQSADIRYARGVRALSNDDNDLAITEFTKAIELDPAHVFARINRARANNNLDKQDAALRDLHAANALRPNHSAILKMRGQAYLALDDFMLARDYLDAAIAANPDDAEAKEARAAVREKLGETAVPENAGNAKAK